ncbi:Bcr/CflA family drug resistance efflux transporter [Streptomyces olivaceoviridis]|uniref:MFS transporter n=1 Tax=Streptomyces olivaceoviridis TaxID=1921 RepID=UPI001997A88B|nr:Bcr/CflA family drug resistance efflux transporter [Streptomyces olivaceoviridis]
MNKKKFLPTLLVVALIGTIIELDMSVPSFPDIARTLDASESSVQLTVTYNFFGYCLGALAYGPLSDRFGRRGVMLAGNAVMLAGALGCAVAPTIEFLLASRFVQGIGASTSVVLVFVIIADVYEGTRLLKMFGLTNAAMSTFMTAAPALGGLINRTLGWRGNYAVVFAVTLVSLLLMALFLPETKTERVKVSARRVAGDYRRLLGSGEFLAASLVPSLLFAAYMVFIAASSFLYTDTFGLSTVAFAGNLLVIVASFAITSLFATKIMELLGSPGRTVACAITATLAGVALFLAFGDGPVSTTVSLAVFCVGFAAVYPVVFGRSLQVFPELQGAASSLNMSSRALLVTLFTGVASSLFTGDAVVTAGVMAVATAVAAPLAVLTSRTPAGEQTSHPSDAMTGAG